ncbi:transporter substrate-binding domain-containing protein [Fischerella sp. JS2]|uniref:transporter substrate-binding domain-containing protein n=1 Tax=Fischerella sp. JS2 TaxID=2597771 RepID=UPI0028E56FCE|nr:transporter substrate-binding domain-containing protein [Fischerella sp. JS2]
MARSKRSRSEDTSSQSIFVKVVEKYLVEAGWTKQQLMAEIKVGETQFYRWARGDNVPKKAIVSRIAVILARRLDEIRQQLPHDPFPASDEIDGILNELLEAAGYRAFVRGKGADSSWYEIAKKEAWTLGYTSVPKWSEPPNKDGAKPTGLVIEYAERIGRLLGIHTNWKYLDYDQMPLAIQERQVDGIAPFILVLPGRFFSFRFSERCSEDSFRLAALISPDHAGSATCLEDLPSKSIQLLYLEGELAEWGVAVLDSYEKKSFEDDKQAISYLLATAKQDKDIIPVFLVDSVTGHFLASENKLKIMNVETIDLETYSAFAFHPDEEKLITAVNSAIKLTPRIIKSVAEK